MEIAPKADETLKSVEEQNEAAMFVFISDLWLDRPEVMTRLKRLLLGKVSHKKVNNMKFSEIVDRRNINCETDIC